MGERTGAFVLRDDGGLTSLSAAEFAKEQDFQDLLARYPELIAGDQIDPTDPRRWVLVKREMPVTTGEGGALQWSLDHLFLDQDGIPTLVEVKRQSDTRIRREVVGQMLDYAANCQLSWPLERLISDFEATCAVRGIAPQTALEGLTNLAPEEFWHKVRTNMLAGRIRMLFVADQVPTELRRIVEFLNTQMSPAEVLALELRQFAGAGIKTILPIVFGGTQEAADRKADASPGVWDDKRIFEKLASTVGPPEVAVARAIVDWMKRSGRTLAFGTGRANGSVYIDLRPNGMRINPIYLSTDGRIYVQFGSLQNKPVFGSLERRRALRDRLNAIGGVDLTDNDLTKYPSISLARIAADPSGTVQLLSILDWMLELATQAGA